MTPKQIIMSANVEFMAHVPVHPNEAGALAIIEALYDAGYKIVPRTATSAMAIAGGAVPYPANVYGIWSNMWDAVPNKTAG